MKEKSIVLRTRKNNRQNYKYNIEFCSTALDAIYENYTSLLMVWALIAKSMTSLSWKGPQSNAFLKAGPAPSGCSDTVQFSFEYFLRRRFHSHSRNLFHSLTAIIVNVFLLISNQNFPCFMFDCCLKKVCFIIMLPVNFTFINKTFYMDIIFCRRGAKAMTKKKAAKWKYKWTRNKNKRKNQL